jgi:2-octaprenylphenol hydroxylase
MQNLDTDVVIVGSGIVGATLACALLQQGMQVTLIEAKPLPTTPAKKNKPEQPIDPVDPRTFALTRASERILTRLGLWDLIMPQGVSPFREIHVWDANGSGEIHFDSASLAEPNLGYIVEQSVLQSALTTRLAEFKTLTYYRPAKVQYFHLTTNQAAMQVYLDNNQQLTTRLLVGAEGAHSPTRSLAGIPYKLLDHGQQAIVATVQTQYPHQETAWQRFLTTGPLAFLPLIDPYTSSIVWSIDTSLGQHLMKLDKIDFHQELEQAFAAKLGKIIASSERVAFPLQSRYVLNYVQPRLALVGDAAHTILPLAGQGLNLGLLDAAALSEVIFTAQAQRKDFGGYQELRRYERWRKSDNLAMLKAMDSFKYLFSTSFLPITWARNVGLSFVDVAMPIKQMIMRQAMGLSNHLPSLAQS